MRTAHLALLTTFALAGIAAAPLTLAAEPTVAPEGCRLVDVAGTPDDDTDDVLLCESTHYVRAGDAPLSNVASAVFSTEAPSGAPVGGAGLGSSVTDVAVQGDPAHGLEVTGTFTGAVDTLEVQVYVAMVNGARVRHGVTPAIEVNGYDFGGALVEDAVVTAQANGTALVTFRIEDMLELWPLLRFSYDADVEHTLRVNLSPYFVGDDGAYLYDGTEVPSAVVLNG